MKKHTFLTMGFILGVSLSSPAQTTEILNQDKNLNAITLNDSIEDSLLISDSIQIKPEKFNQINIDGSQIVVIDGKVCENGYKEIEPGDIQSVRIVKNKGVSSLYGNKNASSVIIVTTRKGANESKGVK